MVLISNPIHAQWASLSIFRYLRFHGNRLHFLRHTKYCTFLFVTFDQAEGDLPFLQNKTTFHWPSICMTISHCIIILHIAMATTTCEIIHFLHIDLRKFLILPKIKDKVWLNIIHQKVVAHGQIIWPHLLGYVAWHGWHGDGNLLLFKYCLQKVK